MKRPALKAFGPGVAGRPARDGHEVKFAAAPLPAAAVSGVFEGYAALFGVKDLGGDLIMPGAFRESIAQRGPGGVKLLWQHNPADVIGAWELIGEDAKGLFVRGRLDLAVARARETLSLLRSRAVDGLSIGFKTVRSRRDPTTGLRTLQTVDLWEISVVTFPMQPNARVADVKAVGAAGNAALLAAIHAAAAAMHG